MGESRIKRMGIDLYEALADYAHRAWSGWMADLYDRSLRNEDGSVTIPAALVARWERQVATAYADLTEEEKKSNRTEAREMMEIVSMALYPHPRRRTDVTIRAQPWGQLKP